MPRKKTVPAPTIMGLKARVTRRDNTIEQLRAEINCLITERNHAQAEWNRAEARLACKNAKPDASKEIDRLNGENNRKMDEIDLLRSVLKSVADERDQLLKEKSAERQANCRHKDLASDHQPEGICVKPVGGVWCRVTWCMDCGKILDVPLSKREVKVLLKLGYISEQQTETPDDE